MFRAIVIVTPKYKLTPPCGACRQVINEFNPKVESIYFGRRRIGKRFKLSELLRSFQPRRSENRRGLGSAREAVKESKPRLEESIDWHLKVTCLSWPASVPWRITRMARNQSQNFCIRVG